ncbi:hypothetical protein RHSIM_RhsimUnG0040800 [Rhododendron simsii]|uniref:Uncharacterized protein n=1 Tax=Rhododendron simsii TaxID=118357 RepID=A0A834FWV8_RHOSS|nr:hypothetical protein RHSIM_RhsimUnG0040800 [Rhododendron simsii]
MGTSSVTLSPPHSLSPFPKTLSHSSNPPKNSAILQFQLRRLCPRVQASRRISNFPQVLSLSLSPPLSLSSVHTCIQIWRISVLNLASCCTQVGFSVNGVILLAFLWILKAFLECCYVSIPTHFCLCLYQVQVVCTIGSAVFVSTLLIRGIWSGLSYLQQSRNYSANEYDDDNHAWTGAQPVS